MKTKYDEEVEKEKGKRNDELACSLLRRQCGQAYSFWQFPN
jgi:hypothetical protein